MTQHDAILQDIHARVKNSPRYKVGDLVLFMSVRDELLPMVIEECMLNAYWDGYGYKMTSVTHPEAGTMFAHERWIRTIIRSRYEMKQMLRVVS